MAIHMTPRAGDDEFFNFTVQLRLETESLKQILI